VGKSTLLGMIARNTNADVNVVALIGERGREVNDFIDNDLGPEGLARSVLIVTPSNSPPLARLRGAYVATAVAEFFRDQGMDVMLLFDSITRFARAMREIGLASGEPPATRGYTPSMFDSMPKLLERSGTSDKGSITGFYTILVDGDDMDEPVSDTVRGILDGHIVLSRRLAQNSHYPPIDVLQSISRLAPKISGPSLNKAAGVIRRNMAVYAEAEDLINVGAYHSGANPAIDEAIAKNPAIREFLIQGIEEHSSEEETFSAMEVISGVSIPPEEMAGGASGAVGGAKPKASSRSDGLAGGKQPLSENGETQAGSLNSVAALFAGLQGGADGAATGSVDADVAATAASADAEGDSGQ
jgi:flagellum-specific ATP synthase